MPENGPRTSVTVRIDGEEHVLRSTVDPEYTRECAAFLDERVKEIQEHTRLVERHRAVILAALSITDLYFTARAELDDLRKEVTSRAENLAERVEEAVKGPSATVAPGDGE